VAFVAGRRLVFDLGGGLVAVTGLVGGVIGVVAAGLLEYRTLRTLGFVPLLAVGVIEEAAKLIVPTAIVLFWRRHRHPADGLLLGVACGAGFAVLETMGYAFVALVQSSGNVDVVQQVLFLRGVLSPAAHMAWTGLTAAALFTAAAARWRAREVGRFVVVFVVVAALHATWDALAAKSWVPDLAVAAVSLALLTATAHRLAAPQRRGLPALPQA
jgi:RsiW-degrading membrane proteinase PrsW (M82 family)